MSIIKPKYIVKDKTLLILNDFNEKFDLFCEGMTGINIVIFDENYSENKYSKFNQQIILTPNVTVLTFGHEFNQPIILTPYIVHLVFGYNFNQPIIKNEILM